MSQTVFVRGICWVDFESDRLDGFSVERAAVGVAPQFDALIDDFLSIDQGTYCYAMPVDRPMTASEVVRLQAQRRSLADWALKYLRAEVEAGLIFSEEQLACLRRLQGGAR